MRVALTVLALLSAGAAAAQPSPVGRTFHYERTNRDGSEPEQIYMHRAAADRVVVYKMVEKCTRSALVTAVIDPESGEPGGFIAAQLKPGAASEPYASIVADYPGQELKGSIFSIHPPLPLTAAIGARPWHLYDFDLGTLAAAFQARPGSRAPMRFGMAMTWSDAKSGPKLLWLGDAEARFAGIERHMAHNTLRFDVSGPAFDEAGGGPLWVDAADGHIVDVQWGRPNHDNYRDFRLRLIGEEPAGDAAWAALLTRHFESCSSASVGTSTP